MVCGCKLPYMLCHMRCGFALAGHLLEVARGKLAACVEFENVCVFDGKV
jgi:hypothetical protein